MPRDGSEQGSRRPSISGRSGSGSSSRSTSFSLPPETIGREFRGAYVDGEVEFEEEMDEEGMFSSVFVSYMHSFVWISLPCATLLVVLSYKGHIASSH